MLFILAMFLPAVGVAIWVGFLLVGRMIFKDIRDNGQRR